MPRASPCPAGRCEGSCPWKLEYTHTHGDVICAIIECWLGLVVLYKSGMGFVQFYFGVPIAMVVICMVFIPLYHRLKVYTAYEFLEGRFDLKTRSLAAILFLIRVEYHDFRFFFGTSVSSGISRGIGIRKSKSASSSLVNLDFIFRKVLS